MTHGNLKHAAYSAARWTSASAVGVAVLQALQVIVLARFLAPADFGLMAIVSASMGIMLSASDLGLGKALIHFPEANSRVLSTLYWTNVACAMLIAMLACAASFVLSQWFSPSFVPLMCLASLAFPIAAIGQQYRALAEKRLRFFDLAVNETVAAALGCSVAVTAGVMGMGAFALAYGMLATVATNAALAWIRLSDGTRPGFHFDAREVRPFAKFGALLVADSMVTTLNRQADVLIGGSLSSHSSMGFYSLPRDLSLKVALIVNPIASRIGFPLMSLVRAERDRLGNIYLKGISLTTSINFPIYLFLAAFAPDVIAILYGKTWLESADFLRVLAAWGLMRSLSNPVGSLLYATGRARLALSWNLVLLAIFLPALWFGTYRFGLQGLAWTMLLLQLGIVLPSWRLLVYPATGLPLRRYADGILRPLVCAASAACIAITAAHSAGNHWTALAIGGGAMGIAYAGTSWVFNRLIFDAFAGLLRPGSAT